MIFLPDRQVGTEVTFLIEGNFPSPAYQAYLNGTITTLTVNFSSMGSTGPTVVSFTPPTSGLYGVVMQDGSIAAQVDVVTKNTQTFLKNIEDEALGSWNWNRAEGTLQLLRQDGSDLASFAVVDTPTESSRERIQ
ncbi:MAG TPA: hypothetical protein VFM18_08670 [Methanosarcina sp.]|nr:hypothetical protein [Methanosarcina sp.]